jgi:hypothetical protein
VPLANTIPAAIIKVNANKSTFFITIPPIDIVLTYRPIIRPAYILYQGHGGSVKRKIKSNMIRSIMPIPR